MSLLLSRHNRLILAVFRIADVEARIGAPGIVVFNAAGRVRGPIAELDPDAIADAYLAVLVQPRSAWSSEVELRPWVERF